MAGHLILRILLDEERQVPGCCHENVSCLLCGEERQDPGHHPLPLSDAHDLHKVVVTRAAGRKGQLGSATATQKPPFSSYMLPDEHTAFMCTLQ